MGPPRHLSCLETHMGVFACPVGQQAHFPGGLRAAESWRQQGLGASGQQRAGGSRAWGRTHLPTSPLVSLPPGSPVCLDPSPELHRSFSHLNLSCASPREVWVSEQGSQMPSLSVLLMAQATDCHQETRTGGSGRSCGTSQNTDIWETL